MASEVFEIRLVPSPEFSGKGDNSLLYLSVALCISALGFCMSVMLDGERLTIVLALISLALPLAVAYRAATWRGILDPAAIFPAGFAAYNGVLLVRLASPDVQQNLLYPLKFEQKDFFSAAVASALGSLALALVALIWDPKPARIRLNENMRGWFGTGLLFYLLGLVFYFLQYSQIGGYWSALSTNRVDRAEMLTDTLSLPFFPFVVVGVVMMTMAGVRQTRRKKWVVAAVIAWFILLLLQGDRRVELQTLLSILAAATLALNKKPKPEWRYLVLAASAYLIFAIFGQLRVALPVMIATGISPAQALTSVNSTILAESIKPENTEFAGPYLSVLVNTSETRHKTWGRTYLSCIFTPLPRAIYPGRKTISPASQLAERVNEGPGAPPGWGYSPVAEAFLNFGFPGVLFMTAVWMALFCRLSDLRCRTWGPVFISVLAPQCVNINRIDFRTVYLETFFGIVCIGLAALTLRTSNFLRTAARRIP